MIFYLTSAGPYQVPGTAPLETNLGQSEIEIGMGIHNESGHQTVSPIPPLSQLILRLIDMTISTSDPDRSFVPFKGQDDVVLLVNNLGGLSELELGAIVGQTRDALDVRGLKALRVLSGSFMVRNLLINVASTNKLTEQLEHAGIFYYTSFVTTRRRCFSPFCSAHLVSFRR